MKNIFKFLQHLPLGIVNFKLIENFILVDSGDYFLGHKQIISTIIIIFIDLMIVFKVLEWKYKLCFFIYLLVCIFDILRYSVITVISEIGFSINGYGVEIITQPLSIKLLVIFFLLNLNTVKLVFNSNKKAITTI